MIPTGSQEALPEARLSSLLDGSWMVQCERHAREDSPVVWWLRGTYNEMRYRLGALQNSQVHVGRDGWLHLRSTLDLDAAELARDADRRLRRLEELRRRAERLGVGLFAIPVPDKVTIYPESVYGPEGMPESRAAVFRMILGELRRAAIPCLDTASVLAAARRRDPGQLLFHQRDTHWTLAGVVAVAQAAAQAIEASELAAAVGPRVEVAPGSPLRVEVVPDLVGLLGLLSWSDYRPELGMALGRPASLLTSRLTETKEYWTVSLAGSAAGQGLVALAGSSFSVDNGLAGLTWFLGRAIDGSGAWNGAGPWAGLDRVLDAVERGESVARLVIWEFVERSLADPAWVR